LGLQLDIIGLPWFCFVPGNGGGALILAVSTDVITLSRGWQAINLKFPLTTVTEKKLRFAGWAVRA